MAISNKKKTTLNSFLFFQKVVNQAGPAASASYTLIASLLIFILRVCFFFNSYSFSFKLTNFPKPDAARSLAIPLIPRQSGLFGVIDKSMSFDFDFKKKLFPILFSYFFDNYAIPSP